jgi:hypothetical protein
VNSGFHREIEAISDHLFRVEHGLNELLESVIRLHLTTYRSLVNLTVEDAAMINQRQHEELDVVLQIIKNLLDKCRNIQGDLGVVGWNGANAIAKAQQRLQEQLDNYRKKDSE